MSSIRLTRLSFTKRIAIFLMALLILQCIIAYGALLVFDVLPVSITGVPKEQTIQYNAQKGAASLIRLQIMQNQDMSAQQVVENLQPLFGYPLKVIPFDKALTNSVCNKLALYGTAYDQEKDILFVDLNGDEVLQLGPILMRDILESDLLPFSIFIFFWSLFNVAVFFTLIYFVFIHFWRDLVRIRQTAEQWSQGNLKARTGSARSWLFKPLASAFNNMGTHIEHLITTRQTISHAMAHELRTPLARMRFELSMLDEAIDEQEKNRLRKGIDDDVNELESLINVSLSYFKMQQNKIKLDLTEVALNEWSNKLCQSLAIFKPDDFELICNSQDETALLDITLVDTIIKNLLINAFKYAGNKAVLSVFKKEEKVVIMVDDNGAGIPLESRDKIFMPFSRLDANIGQTIGGYGLGLAYVKLIAEFHNGKAFVVTSPLGGARFVIKLKSGE